MERVVRGLVGGDRAGFIGGRSASGSVRRLLHVLDFADSRPAPCAVFSLDAGGAFGGLEWSCVWAVLLCFGFGGHFVYMIGTLCHSPAASVMAGGVVSLSFPLQRGAGQGCPLSPLLFCLSLGPLARAIGGSGVSTEIHDRDRSISLYADDVVLCLDHFAVSVSSVVKEFDDFGRLSGCGMDWSGSALMPIGSVGVGSSVPSFVPIGESFVCLGIAIYGSVHGIAGDNFDSILVRVRDGVRGWRNLGVSLRGRVSTVGMSLLPRFSFFFSVLPLSPPPGCFGEIDSMVSGFVWNDECPRVRLAALQHPGSAGGLAVPGFELYCWSFRLGALRGWVDPRSTVSWRVIEADGVGPGRLWDVLFAANIIGIIVDLVRLWPALLRSGGRLNVGWGDPSSFVAVHFCGTVLILCAEVVHLSSPLGPLWVWTHAVMCMMARASVHFRL